MLSILVYGRNDAHGYNLHKRAALSLNAIAEILTDPADEIVFVDYNTPPDLPTFLDAIADTLTAAALDRLRVIRVPSWVHEERFAHKTHLVALEPVARNVGLRHSNPANQWVLSTNTDMLFIPRRDGGSLTEAVAGLADGYYALPRYDIPEALWESLDRRDPRTNLDLLRAWGAGMHLDEIVLSWEYNAFDAPGDFQLVRRDKLIEIDGFDEDMLIGWHVDSNLFKRLSLVYGAPGDLSAELSGYHCDHTRLATAVHRSGVVENDIHRFVENVDRPDLPSQSATWGLAGVELQEIDLRSGVATRFAAALTDVLPPGHDVTPVIDGRWGPEMLHYDAAHVVHYLADPLTVLPPGSVIAYVGVNPEVVRLLAPLLRNLGFVRPLQVVDVHRAPDVDGTVRIGFDELAAGADAVIFDFALPLPDGAGEPPANIGAWPRLMRWQLGAVLECFDQLVAVDRSRRPGRDARRYLGLNTRANVFEAFFTSRLATTATPFGTRTQHGFVADLSTDEIDAVLTPAKRGPLHGVFGYHMENWTIDYDVGTELDFTWWGDASRFHLDGWSAPEEFGTWTDGDVATLLLDLQPSDAGAASGYLCCFEPAAFLATPERPVDVDVVVNGEPVGRFGSADERVHPASRRFFVPAELATKMQPLQLQLRVEGARSPMELGMSRDARRLGVQMRSIVFRPRDVVIRAGDRVVLRDPCAARDWLVSGWSATEPSGVWTVGPRAELLVEVPGAGGDGGADLVIELWDQMVRPGLPAMAVDVAVNGSPVDRWTFAVDEPRHHIRRVPLRHAGPAAAGPVAVSLTIDRPVRPVDADLGTDDRALGIRVASLAVVRAGAPDPPLLAPPDTPRWKQMIERAKASVTNRRARP